LDVRERKMRRPELRWLGQLCGLKRVLEAKAFFVQKEKKRGSNGRLGKTRTRRKFIISTVHQILFY
jgi:hypothetical protein